MFCFFFLLIYLLRSGYVVFCFNFSYLYYGNEDLTTNFCIQKVVSTFQVLFSILVFVFFFLLCALPTCITKHTRKYRFKSCFGFVEKMKKKDSFVNFVWKDCFWILGILCFFLLFFKILKLKWIVGRKLFGGYFFHHFVCCFLSFYWGWSTLGDVLWLVLN